MPDYKQGKIYSLRSYQTDQVYIGSTIQPLYKRLYSHKLDYKKWMKGKYNYVSSYEIVKYDDAFIELIEEYPCQNKMQLDRREGQIIRVTDKCVNMLIAGRTKKEYIADNKDKILQDKKEYYEQNRERILQRVKECYKANKTIILQRDKEYRTNNKNKISRRRKELREKNKDVILQRDKDYYEKNRNKISQQRKDYYEKNKYIIKAKRTPIGLFVFGL